MRPPAWLSPASSLNSRPFSERLTSSITMSSIASTSRQMSPAQQYFREYKYRTVPRTEIRSNTNNVSPARTSNVSAAAFTAGIQVSGPKAGSVRRAGVSMRVAGSDTARTRASTLRARSSETETTITATNARRKARPSNCASCEPKVSDTKQYYSIACHQTAPHENVTNVTNVINVTNLFNDPYWPIIPPR